MSLNIKLHTTYLIQSVELSHNMFMRQTSWIELRHIANPMPYVKRIKQPYIHVSP